MLNKLQNRKLKFNSGFTLAELIISIFIISILYLIISSFGRDIFLFNSRLTGNMNAQLEARHLVKVIVAELREASPSNLGAYPIALASTSAITFYSDVDNNGFKERVRYFINDSSLKRGVVSPSGDPLVYNDSNEKIITLASNIVSSSTLPLFQYYSANYSGTSSPMTHPVPIVSIRLIKINLIINKDPNRFPVPMITTSQVSLRNLKDNF